MSHSTTHKIIWAASAALMLAGMMRAFSDQFDQKRDAIFAVCRSDAQKAGGAAAVKKANPTPEVTLCKCVRITPGGTGDVVVRGTFRPGTKFLFESDKVQVLKEALVPVPGKKEAEYRATVKAAPVTLPEFIGIQSFEPQLCRGISCPAVYIGGKYEWNFTGDNGWKIQLRETSEPGCNEGGASAEYHAEFFKGGEPKAFEAATVKVSCHQGECSGEIEEGQGAAAQGQKMLSAMQNVSQSERAQSDKRVKEIQAQMEAEQKKMANFASLSQAEQQKIITRLGELGKQLADAMTPKGVAEAQKAAEQNKSEFGCHYMDFHLNGTGLAGVMRCGEKVGNHGELNLQGTSKFVG